MYVLYMMRVFFWLKCTNDAFCVRYKDSYIPHLVCVSVVEKVGPVWIRLHKPELKQLSETQLEDVETDLGRRGEVWVCLERCCCYKYHSYFHATASFHLRSHVRLWSDRYIPFYTSYSIQRGYLMVLSLSAL